MRKILKKIRRIATKTAKEHEGLRGPIRAGMNFYRLLRYKLGTFSIKTDPRTVIFASFGGQSYSDNPRAIFEYMVACKDFDDYTFIWGFKKNLKGHMKWINSIKRNLRAEELEPIDLEIEKINAEIKEEEPNEQQEAALKALKEKQSGIGPKIVCVKFGGRQWRKNLAKAGWWILNYKVDDYLKPKKNQTFLQCWHGTPLKRLGNDLEHFDNVLNTEAGMKKRYAIEAGKFDYFISPSPFATEKFKSAWLLDEYGKGNIMLETGYPRNDFLYNYTEEDTDRIKIRILGFYYLPYEKYIKKKTIVLYAPTYRSNQHKSGVGYVYKEEVDFDKLREELEEDFIILFRPHYFIANKFNFSKYKGFVYDVSKVNDINDLYVISDILVTDYSSSMFDYANLKRPMIFYMYDLEHYRDESNGFYFDPEEVLPGPIVKTDDELISELKNQTENFVYDEKYRKFNEKFDPWDDGRSSMRVVESVFRKAEH